MSSWAGEENSNLFPVSVAINQQSLWRSTGQWKEREKLGLRETSTMYCLSNLPNEKIVAPEGNKRSFSY